MTTLTHEIQRGPIVMLVHGVPGVGKTTFAAGAPTPVIVGPERNDNIACLKFPRTKSHVQLMDYLQELERGKHDAKQIRTTVLDAITSHERIVHSEIMATEPGKTMVTARKGFGKAYSEATAKFMEIRNQLDLIINKKEMNVIVLGHSNKVEFNDPMLGTSYDTYEMGLHKTKKVDDNDIFYEWADSILFLNWRSYLNEEGNHATSVGRREIRTEFRPSHTAKNRYSLPEKIDMDMQNPMNTFNILMGHMDNFYNNGMVSNTVENDVNVCVHKIKELLSYSQDLNLLQKVELAVNNANGNLSTLIEIRDYLYTIINN